MTALLNKKGGASVLGESLCMNIRELPRNVQFIDRPKEGLSHWYLVSTVSTIIIVHDKFKHVNHILIYAPL